MFNDIHECRRMLGERLMGHTPSYAIRMYSPNCFRVYSDMSWNTHSSPLNRVIVSVEWPKEQGYTIDGERFVEHLYGVLCQIRQAKAVMDLQGFWWRLTERMYHHGRIPVDSWLLFQYNIPHRDIQAIGLLDSREKGVPELRFSPIDMGSYDKNLFANRLNTLLYALFIRANWLATEGGLE